MADLEPSSLLCGEEVPKSSLDDRLQSLVSRRSLGSVLLQEYAESEESGDRPYSPTATPFSPSPGRAGDQDDESVTTPTPQVDLSPVVTPPEEAGPPKFNPANPILKALYHSPTGSPEEQKAESVEVGSELQTSPPAIVSEKGLLLGVDTGMLQNILKNVQGLKQPVPNSPSVSSPSTLSPKPSETEKVDLPRQPPSAVLSSASAAADKPPTNTSTSGAGIKITSTLTTLLDEIFPQLSKSLQERKRKQEPPSSGPESPAKQARMDTPQSQPGGPGPVGPPASAVRPSGPLPLNGSPRPPLRGLGPGRPPPEMMLRPPRPPPDAGGRPAGFMLMRPRGPLFEGPFRLRGPPRLDGGFRPLGRPRLGERPRGHFGPRNPNSGPPPRQLFPPPSSFQPRPPNQSFPRPLFRPGGPPPMGMGGNSGMEPNHFPEKPPQSHDSLPPPGMGIWP